jgi:hypothetical protein
MDILKNMITVIKAERQRRVSLLTDKDPDIAYDQWLFTHEPFVNELCLMLLVTLWHQVERELVGFAARAADDATEISGEQYQERVREERKLWRNDRKKICASLKLKSCDGHISMRALRLLANLYKHNPSKEPDKEMLQLLKLETGGNYAPLPESQGLQEGLAVFIGLRKDASY